MGGLPKDVTKTMSLISEFMPELRFTKDDLVNGNPSFVCEFFTLFINETQETVGTMFNQEFGLDDCSLIQNFSDELSLYCRVVRILQNFAQFIPCPTLLDFYVPNKKMYPIVKFCINFIIYTNGGYTDVAPLFNHKLKKISDYAKLEEMKQEHLEAMAETAESVAKMTNSLNKLKANSEAETEELEIVQMKADSVAKTRVQKNAEVCQLRSEVDGLEVKLKLVEETENELQTGVVSPSEYEELVKNEKYLQSKLQQISADENELCANFEKEANVLRYLQESAKLFSCADLDLLDCNEYNNVRAEIEDKTSTLQKMEENIIDLEEQYKTTVLNIQNFKNELDLVSKSEADLNKKFAKEKEQEERLYKEEIDKQSKILVAQQRKVTEILKFKEELREIAHNDSQLTKFVISEYNRILQENKKTTDAFYEMLSGINEC